MTTTAYSITEWKFLTEHRLFRRLIKIDPFAGWVLYRVLWDYAANQRTEVLRCWDDADEMVEQLRIWTRFDAATIRGSLNNLFDSGLAGYEDGVVYIYGCAKKHKTARAPKWHEEVKKKVQKSDACQNLTEPVKTCQDLSNPVKTCQDLSRIQPESASEQGAEQNLDKTCQDLSEPVKPCQNLSCNMNMNMNMNINSNSNSNRNINSPPPPSGVAPEPSPPVRDASQVSEIPEPCSTRTALFEETPKDKDNPETPQGMSRWKPLITDDTPRELTAQGEEFLATLHDYIRDGNQQAGSGKRLAAYNMLVDTVGISPSRATHIVAHDPLVATLLVCAGLIDYTKTPAALIITLIKNKADLNGTRIYNIVKSALNGRLANAQ